MPVSQEEKGSPKRGSRWGRGSERTNEIEGATLNVYILHLKCDTMLMSDKLDHLVLFWCFGVFIACYKILHKSYPREPGHAWLVISIQYRSECKPAT